MKIGIAQINPTVGALHNNAEKIIKHAHEGQRLGAELIIYPELCVTGYPPMDLLENPSFIEATQQTIRRIAEEIPENTGAIVGAPVPNSGEGKKLHNSALLLENGRVVDQVYKTLLPTYDIFDEYRYFMPGEERRVIHWRDLRIGLHICEDMWNNEDQGEYHQYDVNPIEELGTQGVDLFVNISASPYHKAKHTVRNDIIAPICKEYQTPFLYANQVGTNTEIIFDGDSRIHDSNGDLVQYAPSFEESLLVWESEAPSMPREPRDVNIIEELHDALILGIRDYFNKTNIFNKVLIGLSGGIDSAVTCALAAKALGAEQVVGVSMPSAISSEHSKTDAQELAENLDIEFHTIAINEATSAFDKMLKPLFEGTQPGVAEENIQARARGMTLMAISNKFDYLVLSTGNKSEMAVGYNTLYGDMSGGLAVLSDVLKMEVYALAEYINQDAGRPVIPENTIQKPPSAELRRDQKDSDTLPPYPVLDTILEHYIERRNDVETIEQETGYERSVIRDIVNRVDHNEYKRRQAPPGLRVSSKAFGTGRRMPIVMDWDRTRIQQFLEEHTSSQPVSQRSGS